MIDEGIPSIQGKTSDIKYATNNDAPIAGVTSILRDVSFPVAVFISLLSWGLLIPVDEGGLATFKNHFFHSLNTASCLLSMLVLDQEWRSSSVILPFRYGIAYALMTWILQSSGGY